MSLLKCASENAAISFWDSSAGKWNLVSINKRGLKVQKSSNTLPLSSADTQACGYFSLLLFCNYITSLRQLQQLLGSNERVIYFSYVLMSFGSLKPGGSAPFDQSVLPNRRQGLTDHSLRTFVVDIIDCMVPFTLRVKSVTFITETEILCQLIHFVFLTEYIFI